MLLLLSYEDAMYWWLLQVLHCSSCIVETYQDVLIMTKKMFHGLGKYVMCLLNHSSSVERWCHVTVLAFLFSNNIARGKIHPSPPVLLTLYSPQGGTTCLWKLFELSIASSSQSPHKVYFYWRKGFKASAGVTSSLCVEACVYCISKDAGGSRWISIDAPIKVVNAIEI